MFRNRSYESQRAFELFSAGKVGDTISAEKMTEQINRDCWSGVGYSYVNGAIKRCLNECNILWTRDRVGKCYRCEGVDGVNKAQQFLIKQAQGRAKKSLTVALCAKTDDMNNDQRNQHNINTLVAGLVVTATSSPTRKKLDGKTFSQPSTDDLMRIVTGK